MTFYDCYGNEHNFNLNDNQFLNVGCQGNIYHYTSEWVLKVYYDYVYNLRKEIYDAIKEINSPCIAEIKDLLFKEKIVSMGSDLNHLFQDNKIDAYTCRYIEPAKVDILTMPTDYLISCIYDLSEVFYKFSKKGVLACDLKPDNTIIQEDKIVLIDLDLFRISSENGLNGKNQIMLLGLFRELIINNIYEYDHDINFIDIIEKIFNPYQFFLSNSEIKEKSVLEVAKQFKKYKYPIDYIKEISTK